MKTRRFMRLFLLPVLLAGAAVALSACAEAPKPSIILIAVDTLRADALGCYGASKSATPRMDEWAKDAVLFKYAYTQSPWTLPAFASLFTAAYPSSHDAGGQEDPTKEVGQKSFYPIRKGHILAAQSFKKYGYQTAAYVNNIFLKGNLGFSLGFDHFDFYPSKVRKIRRANKVSDLAIEWLQSRENPETPCLLFLHYFDPHFAYMPPPEFRDKFDGKLSKRILSIDHPELIRRGEVKLDDADKENLRNLYLGEVAYTDHEVGRLLDHLRISGLMEKSVVIIFSDHGEEFWDHDGFEHGHCQFEEVVHVPMMIRFPEKEHAGLAVEEPVRLMDLMPTLHDLCDMTQPSTFEGVSFLPLVNGSGPAYDVPFLFENCLYGNEKKAIRYKDLKLIMDMNTKDALLFDLAADPLEKNDIAESRSDQTDQMKKAISSFLKNIASNRVGQNNPVELSPELMKDLKDLGYVR